ncbi:uncharacterized protein ACN427_001598 [Glossina fuscipes fuscipes]
MTVKYFHVLVVSAVVVIFFLPIHNCVPVPQHYSAIYDEYAAPSAPIVTSAEYYADPNQYYALVPAEYYTPLDQYYLQLVQSYASLLPLSSYYYPQPPSYAAAQPTIPPGQYYPELSALPPFQHYPSLPQYYYYATPPPERIKVVNIFA